MLFLRVEHALLGVHVAFVVVITSALTPRTTKRGTRSVRGVPLALLAGRSVTPPYAIGLKRFDPLKKGSICI